MPNPKKPSGKDDCLPPALAGKVACKEEVTGRTKAPDALTSLAKRVRAALSGAPLATGERRLVVMANVDDARAQSVATALTVLDEIHAAAKKEGRAGDLHSMLMWSIDDKLHKTDWSNSPRTHGGTIARAGCYRGETRFTDALQACLDEIHGFGSKDGVAIDAIVLVGNECTDETRQLMALSDLLAAKGTRVITLQLGKDPKVAAIYQILAEKTDGVHLQLTHDSELGAPIATISDMLFRGREALLVRPGDAATVKRLKKQLLPKLKK